MEKYDWTDHYSKMTERNIGIISFDEQELIRNTHIAIFGTGGMGGRIAEILVRSGCEKIRIIDKDTYSLSNLSTQNITQNDVNKKKVDVLEKKFIDINPDLELKKYDLVDETNISEILQNVQIACLSLDGPLASIIVARECRKRKIPLIEAWSTPLLYAWWFTEDSIDYESCYKFNTREKSYSQIRKIPDFQQHFRDSIFNFLEAMPNIPDYYGYKINTMEKMKKGELSLRSFAPFVYMTGSYIAFEIIFSGILHRKQKVIAPAIISYDLIASQIEKF